MPAYKDEERGTWRVVFSYKDWKGSRRRKQKRGFKTRREALEFERSFLNIKAQTLDMKFKEFYELYKQDRKAKLRENTWRSKEYIVQEKLIPFFGEKRMNEINSSDIMKWQNELISKKDEDGNPLYSHGYLKTCQSQLSAIFNHAVRIYELRKNPVHAAGPIGGDFIRDEMDFWTLEEYKKFIEQIDDVVLKTAFEVLFWCGLRIGEMLALTPADIDFNKGVIKITKSLQRIEGRIVITPPKTRRGVRTVTVTPFLLRELEMLVKLQYGLRDNDRIFQITKSVMHRAMETGSKAAGVKQIRIHDLRHSHVSMLLNMGFSAVEVARRVGHESTKITMRYAHAYPGKQQEIAEKLTEMNIQ